MDFWGISVSDEVLKKALAMTTKEEMNKRLPNERKRNKIVSFDRPKTMFSDDVLDEIRKIIKNNLRYDFGYVHE